MIDNCIAHWFKTTRVPGGCTVKRMFLRFRHQHLGEPVSEAKIERIMKDLEARGEAERYGAYWWPIKLTGAAA
jgi:hypothetical protein